VELKHDARDKKFGMIFGAAYSKFENVICKAKIDEKFNVCSSFKIIINPNITLTVSNAVRKCVILSNSLKYILNLEIERLDFEFVSFI